MCNRLGRTPVAMSSDANTKMIKEVVLNNSKRISSAFRNILRNGCMTWTKGATVLDNTETTSKWTKGATVLDNTETTSKRTATSTRTDNLIEDLLPGISNDVTLKHVTANLSWQELHTLSSVSRDWRKAIQVRRVLSHSVETLAVVLNRVHASSFSDNINTVTLYSMKDKSWYQLPPIPGIRKGRPFFCKCVSVKGKIYAFGGAKVLMHYTGSTKVYVLDVAGHRKLSWTLLNSCEFPGGPTDCFIVPSSTLVDGELLVRARWYKKDQNKYGEHVYQSKGIGNDDRDIVWEKAKCSSRDVTGSFGIPWGPSPVIITMQL